jgi:signal transduction histidine kinase
VDNTEEQKTTILIVEDELLIAKNLSHKLEKLGYEVADIVSSGCDAIQRAGELKPDLILMDIVIKGEIDGIEAAAKIHQTLDIPVIYTTAYADEETLQRAAVTGSYGYVLKPFKERELHASIKIALSQYKAAVKLRQLIELAAAKSENKSRYISMAYHDLNTPLTTIQLSAEMLEDSEVEGRSDNNAKSIDRIKKAASSMNQLLEHILMLSKVDFGKLPLSKKLINAVDFCKSVLEEIQPIATKKHQLNFISQTESLEAYFDENLLRHLVLNLLSNAIKYSPKGGTVSLELSCDNQQIIFCVRDEGIGIPEEYLGKLFEQFERGTNVGNIKGTGLGLCIVKHIVDLHGGKISVESEIDRGTAFIVAIPFQGSFEF